MRFCLASRVPRTRPGLLPGNTERKKCVLHFLLIGEAKMRFCLASRVPRTRPGLLPGRCLPPAPSLAALGKRH